MRVYSTVDSLLSEAAVKMRQDTGIQIKYNNLKVHKRKSGMIVSQFTIRKEKSNGLFDHLAFKYDNSYRTMSNCLCWHGHKAFFDALFSVDPEATVGTVLFVYSGKEEFNKQFDRTGDTVKGPDANPYLVRDCCTCEQ